MVTQTDPNWWLDYWELSRIEFSELRMRKPSKIPARSDLPRFKPQGLKPNFVVIHKWRRGVVDLTILGAANAVNQIIHLNGDLLGDGVTILPTDNSAAIRIDIPMVDRFATKLRWAVWGDKSCVNPCLRKWRAISMSAKWESENKTGV